jgi:ADP-ribose pyrophosphatase
VSVSPKQSSDPGLSSSFTQTVVIRVDMHGDVVQQLDDGEYIDTHLVEVKGLLGSLDKFVEKGYLIDQKVYHWAAGITIAEEFKLEIE